MAKLPTLLVMTLSGDHADVIRDFIAEMLKTLEYDSRTDEPLPDEAGEAEAEAFLIRETYMAADSARIVDLDAMHMRPAPGVTYSDLQSGYNEALREIAGLERNSETSEG